MAGGGYDLLLVDGPPAWEPFKGQARYPTLPFMLERMNDRCSIYLDGANRARDLTTFAL